MKRRAKSLLLLIPSLAAFSFGTHAADSNKGSSEKKPSSEKTPLDQSNRPEDLKTTQTIRKAVMADDALSMAAKNVQIITAEGKVTLRGKVHSAEEKKKIAAHARKAAGTADVVNQIEIKTDDKPEKK
jgi:hyperosmotically inducible protein